MDKAIRLLTALLEPDAEVYSNAMLCGHGESKEWVYTHEALEELQAYKAKMEEVADKYKQLKNKHDLICHDDCEHLCCLESGECYCEEQDCIRNYNDPSLYIDIYKDKYKQRN